MENIDIYRNIHSGYSLNRFYAVYHFSLIHQSFEQIKGMEDPWGRGKTSNTHNDWWRWFQRLSSPESFCFLTSSQHIHCPCVPWGTALVCLLAGSSSPHPTQDPINELEMLVKGMAPHRRCTWPSFVPQESEDSERVISILSLGLLCTSVRLHGTSRVPFPKSTKGTS